MSKKVEIGDIVVFKDAEGQTITDTVDYIGNGVIEGQKYDLTYVDFTVLMLCEELGI